MIESLWNNFSSVFDYTFPEIQVFEITEVKPGTFRITAYYGKFTSILLTVQEWNAMNVQQRVKLMIGFCHTVLDQIEEIQNG